MVSVKNLTATLDGKKILDDVSCTLEQGRITTFLGKSGAGKTTLLKALANLVPTCSGSITINGQKLNSLSPLHRAQEIGFVFQDFNLFSNLTVLQNCIDPLLVAGKSEQEARAQALQMLEQVGMTASLEQYPSQLSGGQQQRVAIARALCLQPRVLLLDEPTASLDPENTKKLVKILKNLAAQGLTIGVSSQDTNFVKLIFDRIYFVDQGRIVEFCEDLQKLGEKSLIKKFIS